MNLAADFGTFSGILEIFMAPHFFLVHDYIREVERDKFNRVFLLTYLHTYLLTYLPTRGPRWRSWLRQCATSQKVAGSIPDGVIGIFH